VKHKTDYAGHDVLYQQRKKSGARGWDDDPKVWEDWRAEILDLIASAAFPKSGEVLELGCGAGDVALLFAEKGYQATGIDIAPTAIGWAREKALKSGIKADFEVGAVTNLERWEDERFDAVIDGHCLHCIIGEDRAAVLKETCRVLKPGGLFYVNTMCGEPRNQEVIKHFDAVTRCLVWDGVARRYIGRPADIIEEIEKAGFRIVGQEIVPGIDVEDALVLLVKKPAPGQ
jgi:ubiquinone/menaquinone biosynthesis C-methylase UbiE